MLKYKSVWIKDSLSHAAQILSGVYISAWSTNSKNNFFCEKIYNNKSINLQVHTLWLWWWRGRGVAKLFKYKSPGWKKIDPSARLWLLLLKLIHCSWEDIVSCWLSSTSLPLISPHCSFLHSSFSPGVRFYDRHLIEHLWQPLNYPSSWWTSFEAREVDCVDSMAHVFLHRLLSYQCPAFMCQSLYNLPIHSCVTLTAMQNQCKTGRRGRI